jgi:simple sugar transport system ATP-binding protein
LLGALFGRAPVFGGTIELDGQPWSPASPADAIANGVFMAGEDRWRSSLLPSATLGGDIAGTIALPHRKRWFRAGLIDPRREKRAADRAIQALGIRCRDSRDTLGLLSGGNQQKVVIGRWQAATCRLLLLDEPLQGVDVGARRDIVDAIRANRQDGATLIATSDVEEAIEAADIVAVMRDHAIVGLHDLRAGGGASLLAAIAAVEADGTRDNREALA